MTQHQGLAGTDFQAAYLAVRRLADITRQRPAEVTPDSVAALADLLAQAPHASQTQARFLYRDAAAVLLDLCRSAPDRELAARAFAGVETALARPGKPRMAAADAVGALPLSVRGPQMDETGPPKPDASHTPDIAWTALLRLADAGRQADTGSGPPPTGNAIPARAGRTLIMPLPGDGRVVAVKFLRLGEPASGLALEAAWMEHLAAEARDMPVPFHVPRPLRVAGQAVFRVADAPLARVGLDPATLAGGVAMAYVARADYFRYPNEHGPDGGLGGRELLAVLGQNALLFGRLAARGIVHTAPIPLFHNRVQRERRSDEGLYDWRRMGRLDQWLASTRFPNFGPSGLRDFEHFVSHAGPTGPLYKCMGDHLLGLLLVTGSYFRFKEPARVGLGPDGRPADARELFDPALLAEALTTIYDAYYQGFTGRAPAGALPFDREGLAARLIEEMGVDRHMVEMLRVADQENMSDAAFVEFLTRRGMPRQEALGLRRGAADVAIPTGPHLGEFNGRISAPEMIEFTACAAAACVAGRYFAEADGRRNSSKQPDMLQFLS
ncbi:SidJ-related pseudokinase [Desulfovibrio sulfodismutans]|uniref:SidJ-related pseudokinase n=1 Tax=Desulfolutivibrio sulfodismutans TaxID=63561 RepID=A0A7K3NJW6_9BACT|nr:SidJ-related pseudokinase [Desulfolutivibrio sulfodismutans]NDY56417.1 SidJ-related pseudokinase [Desulfolutivibrio sulfodismutans]QLA13821.1 SidJ-related pseudokinase [Desulfolutivibrio sulfodismutans DSM 3696]